MAGVGQPTGCYKCRGKGHWARDCTAVPAAALSSQAPGSSSADLLEATLKPQDGRGETDRRGSSTAAGSSGGKAAVPRQRHKVPKLTPDLLLSHEGLGYVLEKLPQQVTIKGRGHEVEDLKSLLEAYRRWHARLLPYYSYSQFVAKVEKLGANKRVRMCMKELRDQVSRGEELQVVDGANDQGGSMDFNEDAAEEGAYRQEKPQDLHVESTKRKLIVGEGIEDSQQEIQEQQFVHVESTKLRLTVGEEGTKESEQEIQQQQRARMEANKLKALERARARALASSAQG
ncbi:unnamed protein product [Sphagnum troendelagicum]|uniref:CCHC-type domain-containing protein n=1 Tax=Sphagnum troendelagicum TaxID=128251 RepID=A0ABP0V1P7_9BRYO